MCLCATLQTVRAIAVLSDYRATVRGLKRHRKVAVAQEERNNRGASSEKLLGTLSIGIGRDVCLGNNSMWM